MEGALETETALERKKTLPAGASGPNAALAVAPDAFRTAVIHGRRNYLDWASYAATVWDSGIPYSPLANKTSNKLHLQPQGGRCAPLVMRIRSSVP